MIYTNSKRFLPIYRQEPTPPEPPVDYSTLPLTFRAVNTSAQVKIYKNQSPPTLSTKYSYDGETWNNYTVNTTLTIPCGQVVMFKGNGNIFNSWTNQSTYNAFGVSGGNVELYGNVLSLVNWNTSLNINNLFHQIFRDITSTNCIGLYAHNLYLPSGDYYSSSYGGQFAWLFENSTALKTAPIVRTIGAAANMYRYIFAGCTNLSSKVVINSVNGGGASFLAACNNCSNVKCIEVDFTTWPTTMAMTDYGVWVGFTNGVSSTGTFIKPRTLSLNKQSDGSGIPSNWTVVNKENGHMYICNSDNTSDYTREVASVDDDGTIHYV